jgi:hypothetical protein
MIDFGADGGAMSWRSSAGEAEAFYLVDPYLSELGWRAWDCMGEEKHPRANGIPGPLGQLLGGWAGLVRPVTFRERTSSTGGSSRRLVRTLPEPQ